jgi:hypothetical protein
MQLLIISSNLHVTLNIIFYLFSWYNGKDIHRFAMILISYLSHFRTLEHKIFLLIKIKLLLRRLEVFQIFLTITLNCVYSALVQYFHKVFQNALNYSEVYLTSRQTTKNEELLQFLPKKCIG